MREYQSLTHISLVSIRDTVFYSPTFFQLISMTPAYSRPEHNDIRVIHRLPGVSNDIFIRRQRLILLHMNSCVLVSLRVTCERLQESKRRPRIRKKEKPDTWSQKNHTDFIVGVTTSYSTDLRKRKIRWDNFKSIKSLKSCCLL